MSGGVSGIAGTDGTIRLAEHHRGAGAVPGPLHRPRRLRLHRGEPGARSGVFVWFWWGGVAIGTSFRGRGVIPTPDSLRDTVYLSSTLCLDRVHRVSLPSCRSCGARPSTRIG